MSRLSQHLLQQPSAEPLSHPVGQHRELCSLTSHSPSSDTAAHLQAQRFPCSTAAGPAHCLSLTSPGGLGGQGAARPDQHHPRVSHSRKEKNLSCLMTHQPHAHWPCPPSLTSFPFWLCRAPPRCPPGLSHRRAPPSRSPWTHWSLFLGSSAASSHKSSLTQLPTTHPSGGPPHTAFPEHPVKCHHCLP